MTDSFRIYRPDPEPALVEALADILQDCVEGGASVGFMAPLPRAKAVAFWEKILAAVGRGERILLVAEDTESRTIVGTVQVVVAMPENQPHRADLVKMQVHSRARRRGVGAALMRAAEDAARKAGKTLLVPRRRHRRQCRAIVYPPRLAPLRGHPRLRIMVGQGGLCSTTVMYSVLGD